MHFGILKSGTHPMADFKFEQAQTFEEIQQRHAQFIDTFNTTRHWAHRDREDGRKTPKDVLSWVQYFSNNVV